MAESKLHKELKGRAVEYLFNKGCWVSMPEVDCGFYGVYDAWGIQNNENLMTIGIEVKVSTVDYRNNKYKEHKLNVGCDNELPDWIPANLNYILCPSELLQPEKIPKRYGLLWFNGERLVSKKTPLFNEMTNKRKVEVLMRLLASRRNKYPL